MTRSRAVAATGILAGIVANYWLLETLLADRSDPAGSWISDLGARTEGTGVLFDGLEVASGLLIVAFAALLVPALGRRSRTLWWGTVALLAVGVGTVIDGLFPLSCAESLAEPCELRYDAVDLVHAAETVLSTAITIVMFGLLAAGLRADPEARLRGLGAWTAAAGIVWVACSLLIGAQLLIGDLGEVKGLFHRGAQVVLGAWLIAVAVGVRDLPAAGRDAVPRAWQDRP